MALTKNSQIDLNGNEMILDADGDTTITADTDDQIDFKTAGSDRVTINSSGNVGIGTSSPEHALHVDSGTANTVAQFKSTDANAYIEFLDSDAGTSGCFIGGAGDDFVVLPNASEKFRVTSAGNVGIGTTSPSQLLEISGSSDPRIRINNSTTALSAGTSIGGIEYQTNDASGEGTGVGASIEAIAEGSFGYRQQGVLLAFKTRNGGESATNTERMRITQQGNLLKNTTYDGFNAAQVIYATGTNPQATNLTLWSLGGSGIKFVQFVNSSGVQCGSITQNGTSAVTYGSGSDYRLKENVKPLENGLSKVQKLNPVQFDWKESGETNEGFIAHEVQEICKEAVSGQKDGEEMQGVDYGRITPLLVKAIQEQQEQIEALQSEINTLKGG